VSSTQRVHSCPSHDTLGLQDDVLWLLIPVPVAPHTCRRDRSWLLQSIRFLVRNNFLQKLPQHQPGGKSTAQGDDGPRAPGQAPGNGQDGDKCPAAQGAIAAAGGEQQPFAVAPDVLAALDWPPEAPSLAELLPPVPAVDEEEEEDVEGEQVATTHTVPVQGMQAGGGIGLAGRPEAGSGTKAVHVLGSAGGGATEQALEEGECIPEGVPAVRQHMTSVLPV
jgi:hypothetical protein